MLLSGILFVFSLMLGYGRDYFFSVCLMTTVNEMICLVMCCVQNHRAESFLHTQKNVEKEILYLMAGIKSLNHSVVYSEHLSNFLDWLCDKDAPCSVRSTTLYKLFIGKQKRKQIEYTLIQDSCQILYASFYLSNGGPTYTWGVINDQFKDQQIHYMLCDTYSHKYIE